MGQAKEIPASEAIQALNRLLFGKRLAHFHVGHQFGLYLANYVGGPRRPSPPVEVALRICSGFWINDKRKWEEKVASVPSSITEPTVPIRAYELARLCWIADTGVAQVAKNTARITITLENGETINIPLYSEDEFAFCVDDGTGEIRSTFSICCVNGHFYVRGAEFLTENSWVTP